MNQAIPHKTIDMGSTQPHNNYNIRVSSTSNHTDPLFNNYKAKSQDSISNILLEN